MIEIPTNINSRENEVEKGIEAVLKMLTTGADKFGEGCVGDAYLDWDSGIWQNVPSRSIAEEVAQKFADKGYYIYYQLRDNLQPSCIRIHSKPHKVTRWYVER